MDTTPQLLMKQPFVLRVVLVGVVPGVFGMIAGLSLGLGTVPYVVLSVLGIGGGFIAGMEHLSAREGGLRGLLGGALFGTSILIGADLVGENGHHILPHPGFVLPIITTTFGGLLGLLGGRKRGRQEALADA